MKRTGFCGLILLALLMTLLSSVPVFASDHPWDGNKIKDTTITALPSPTGTGSGTEGSNDGDSSDWEAKRSWYTAFIGWISDIFSDKNATIAEENKSDTKVINSKSRSGSHKLRYWNSKK